MFTTQHYTKIAATMKDQRDFWLHTTPTDADEMVLTVILSSCRRLATVFLEDNERFKPDLFLRACGFDPITGKPL